METHAIFRPVSTADTTKWKQPLHRLGFKFWSQKERVGPKQSRGDTGSQLKKDFVEKQWLMHSSTLQCMTHSSIWTLVTKSTNSLRKCYSSLTYFFRNMKKSLYRPLMLFTKNSCHTQASLSFLIRITSCVEILTKLERTSLEFLHFTNVSIPRTDIWYFFKLPYILYVFIFCLEPLDPRIK
jgi:hypothetical protein